MNKKCDWTCLGPKFHHFLLLFHESFSSTCGLRPNQSRRQILGQRSKPCPRGTLHHCSVSAPGAERQDEAREAHCEHRQAHGRLIGHVRRTIKGQKANTVGIIRMKIAYLEDRSSIKVKRNKKQLLTSRERTNSLTSHMK